MRPNPWPQQGKSGARSGELAEMSQISKYFQCDYVERNSAMTSASACFSRLTRPGFRPS
jgi:hypothetical protein